MIVALNPTVTALIDQTQGSDKLREDLRVCVQVYSTPGILFGIVRRVVEAVYWVFANSYWGQSVAFLQADAVLANGDASRLAAEARLWKWVEMNSSPQTTPLQTIKTEAAAATLSPAPQLSPSQTKPTEAVVAAPESPEEEEVDSDSAEEPSSPPKRPEPPSLVSDKKPEGWGDEPLRYLNLNENGVNIKNGLKAKTGKPLELPKAGKIQEVENEDEGFVEKKVNRIEQQTKTTSASARVAQNPQTKKPPAQLPESSQDLPA